VGLGPVGPGVPGGTDIFGDWYMATVQRKVWMIWTQQIKVGFTRPITVSFTILADGTVEGVDVVQGSGVTLLDLAAKRAIYSAAPFGPLPRDYGTNRVAIQAIFQPSP
jgi:TonB family protein